jgi:hypothetical protein
MNHLKISLLAILTIFCLQLHAQEVNWRSLVPTQHHLVSAYFGADYDSYYGLSYGYVVKNGQHPLVLGLQGTAPFGKTTLDDWNLKLSAQTELIHAGAFSMSVQPAMVLRRYASPLARIYGVGADLTLAAGILRPKWGISGILAYDQSMATQVENRLLKTYYPEIQDGWYRSGGGNFKFGMRLNCSFRAWNGWLSLGKAYGLDFKSNPTLPFYAEISVNRAF